MNIGILGCGQIANIMADTITKMQGVTLYAIASRSLDKSMVFKQRYNISKAYNSYEDLAKDQNIDLVYIATPHSFHYEHSMLCLENGRNVLCEKPFAVNAKQAKDLFDKAKENNLFICEAMWTRFMPLAKKLTELIAQNVIGEAMYLSSNLSFYNMDNERMHSPDLAGGALLDLGIYPITIASMVFGNDISKIKASAILTDSGVDKISQYTFIYKNNKMADLASSMCSFSDGSAVISGTNGFIVINGVNCLSSISVYDNHWCKIAQYDKEPQISGYEYEVEACIDAIKNNAKECCEIPHEQTLAILKQMDKIRMELGIKYPFEI